MSKKSFHKNELYRFVIIDNKIIFDKDNKILARGFYISKKYNFDDIQFFCNKRFKMNLEK